MHDAHSNSAGPYARALSPGKAPRNLPELRTAGRLGPPRAARPKADTPVAVMQRTFAAMGRRVMDVPTKWLEEELDLMFHDPDVAKGMAAYHRVVVDSLRLPAHEREGRVADFVAYCYRNLPRRWVDQLDELGALGMRLGQLFASIDVKRIQELEKQELDLPLHLRELGLRWVHGRHAQAAFLGIIFDDDLLGRLKHESSRAQALFNIMLKGEEAGLIRYHLLGRRPAKTRALVKGIPHLTLAQINAAEKKRRRLGDETLKRAIEASARAK